jgi:putative transposase
MWQNGVKLPNKDSITAVMKKQPETQTKSPQFTLEFRLNLTSEQTEKIDRWMATIKRTWNRGVEALETYDRFTYYDKNREIQTLVCKLRDFDGHLLNSRYRVYYLDPDDQTIVRSPNSTQKQKCHKIEAPYTPLVAAQSWWYINRSLKRVKRPKAGEPYIFLDPDGEHRIVPTETPKVELKNSWGWYSDRGLCGYSCPVEFAPKTRLLGDRPEMPITNLKRNTNGLQGLVKSNRIELEDEFTQDIPYKFRQGKMEDLLKSMEEHMKWRKRVGQGESPPVFRGFPKFKGRTDKIVSLNHASPKGDVRFLGDDRISCGGTKLGELKARSLDKRWRKADGSRPSVSVFRIVKRGDGYFLQLASDEVHRNHRFRPRDRAIGIDFGLHDFAISDWDNQEIPEPHVTQRIAIPRYYRKEEDRLAKLQRQLAQKLIHRLILWLNHPERTIDELREHTRISDERARELLQAKTIKQVEDILGGSSTQYFLHRVVPTTQNIQKLEKRIVKLHETVKRRRHAFHHKLSTFIVRYFDIILVESGLQDAKLRQQANPRTDEDETRYLSNRASAKSGLSKSLSDAGHGAFIQMLEYKAEIAGKTVIRVPARDTTKTCACCGHKQDMPPEIRWYSCPKCGWECDRDINSALNVLFYEETRELLDGKILSPLAQLVLEKRNL